MEGGRGDGMYKDKFQSLLSSQCEQHMALKEPGSRFVSTVTRLMELLLEYRSIRQEESRDNQMSCIVNLLDFYSEHGREEMFARHLKKLYDLHIECENWAEAGLRFNRPGSGFTMNGPKLGSVFMSNWPKSGFWLNRPGSGFALNWPRRSGVENPPLLADLATFLNGFKQPKPILSQL